VSDAGESSQDRTPTAGETTSGNPESGRNDDGDVTLLDDASDAPLAPPAHLTATMLGGLDAADVGWTAAPGASSYIVKRGTSPGEETVVASGITANRYLDSVGLHNGITYYYVVSALYGTTESGNSNEAVMRLTHSPAGDVDADHSADLIVYRPSTGQWFVSWSGSEFTLYTTYQGGASTDVPVPGDYDGDNLADLAMYQPSTGTWRILFSRSAYAESRAQLKQWGLSTDTPVPGDYDGDGKTDFAVYRAATGYWYILLSSTGYTTYIARQWGLESDVPVPGDYDGDGKSDLGIYRPSSGSWYILLSGSQYTTYTSREWGIDGDIPAPGDYDGDGILDLAVYRPSTGYWYILRSDGHGVFAYEWGDSDDTIVPADYDRDGRADLAVYRPSTGYWYILKSSTGYTTYLAREWGAAGDIPILRRQ